MEKGNKIILVMGILAIAAGFLLKFEASSFQKKATLTDGKVVHVLGSTYRIQFFTADGIEKIYQGSGKNHKFREGNSVKMWYKTDNPKRVRFTDGRKETKAIFIASAFCILMGIYPLFMKKKANPISS